MPAYPDHIAALLHLLALAAALRRSRRHVSKPVVPLAKGLSPPLRARSEPPHLADWVHAEEDRALSFGQCLALGLHLEREWPRVGAAVERRVQRPIEIVLVLRPRVARHPIWLLLLLL